MIKPVIAQFFSDNETDDSSKLGEWEVNLEEPGVEAQLENLIRGESLIWGETSRHLAEVLANTTHGMIQTKQDMLLVWFELTAEDNPSWIRIIAYATDPVT